MLWGMVGEIIALLYRSRVRVLNGGGGWRGPSWGGVGTRSVQGVYPGFYK